MTGLPTSSATSSASIDNPELNSTSITPYQPSTCLFCNQTSTNVSENLNHMSKTHNFFIPDLDYLIDTPSFLGFLNTIISEFHECLFCGSGRSNKWAAQDHMKSKGHCRIDVEEEEWEDFWYFPDPEGDDIEGQEQDDGAPVSDDKEIHLPSGKTLGHRSQARYFRRNQNRTPLPVPAPRQLQPNPISTDSQSEASALTSSDRHLVMRVGTSTSLIGVPELQQRGLIATEKKAMQVQTRARNRYQSGVERAGNSQKHFKVCRRLERVPGSL
jgi:pre-60S factor REI1